MHMRWEGCSPCNAGIRFCLSTCNASIPRRIRTYTRSLQKPPPSFSSPSPTTLARQTDLPFLKQVGMVCCSSACAQCVRRQCGGSACRWQCSVQRGCAATCVCTNSAERTRAVMRAERTEKLRSHDEIGGWRYATRTDTMACRTTGAGTSPAQSRPPFTVERSDE